MVSESLATIIADQGLGIAGLKLCNLGFCIFIIVILSGNGFELLNRLVLVILKPLKGTLDYWVLA
jgi:hypothetical protein